MVGIDDLLLMLIYYGMVCIDLSAALKRRAPGLHGFKEVLPEAQPDYIHRQRFWP